MSEETVNHIDLQTHPEMLAFKDAYVAAINAAIDRGWEGSPQTLSIPGFTVLRGEGQPDFMTQVRHQMADALARVNELRGPTPIEVHTERANALYSLHMNKLRETAKSCGYGLAFNEINWSIDLIAFPNSKSSKQTTELMTALIDAMEPHGGKVGHTEALVRRPHGMRLFSIFFDIPAVEYFPAVHFQITICPRNDGPQPDKDIRAWVARRAKARESQVDQ